MSKIASILCLIVLLTGCQQLKGFVQGKPESTDPDKICVKLNRQIQYNRRNQNLEASWISNKQRDALKKAYVEHDCSRH